MNRKEQIRNKAKELGQKYFPDEANIWARGNIEAEYVESACIEMAEWLDQYPHWIPVEDELPPENGKTQQSVSVWATDGLTSGEFRYNFDTKTWTDVWGDPFDITHWLPLPQPPRKEE